MAMGSIYIEVMWLTLHGSLWVPYQNVLHPLKQTLASAARCKSKWYIMQAGWRMHAARRRFQKARHYIVRAQALRRCCVAQRQFLALRASAITLQVCNEQA